MANLTLALQSFSALPQVPGYLLGPEIVDASSESQRHWTWPEYVSQRCVTSLSAVEVCLLAPWQFSPTWPAVFESGAGAALTTRVKGPCNVLNNSDLQTSFLYNTSNAPHCARLASVLIDWSILKHPGFIANCAAARRLQKSEAFQQKQEQAEGNSSVHNPHPGSFTPLHLFASAAVSQSCDVPSLGLLALRLALALSDATAFATKSAEHAKFVLLLAAHRGLADMLLGPLMYSWLWTVKSGWHGAIFQTLWALSELLPADKFGAKICEFLPLDELSPSLSAVEALWQPALRDAEQSARQCVPPHKVVSLHWVVTTGRELWRALAGLPWPGRPRGAAAPSSPAWRHLAPSFPGLVPDFAGGRSPPLLTLCGAKPVKRFLGSGAVATVVGASLLAPPQGGSTGGRDGAWVLEMIMLVHGGDDGCVLMVDSYTAETEPQSLLMHWTCEITFISGYQRRSLSVPAVVYSSRQEETLVQCWLDPRAWLDASEDFEALTVLLKPVRAELRPLWTVEEVPLCFRPRPLKRKRLAFCSRPKFGLWDQDSKSMLRQWMRYHHFLGVEHFYLYDNDGSVEGALPWELKDSVTYTSNWPKYFGRNYADILSGSYTCDQAHRTADGRCQVNGSPNKKYDTMLSIPAYTHCLFHARGLVDFLAIAHSVDTYLGTFGSLQNIHSHPLMEAVRASKETQNLALVAVSMLRYGGPVQTVNQSTSGAGFPSVAIAFQHHEPEPMCSQAFMEFRPVRYMCENPQPLMVPEQILATTGEHWPVGRPGTLHVDCNFTVHSMSMIFKQFGYYNTIGLRQHCQTCVVEDKSMLWAEDLLREWANA